MEIRNFVSATNRREVVAITEGHAQLLIPTDVPMEAIKHFRHRLRDRIARPIAWKRRHAREEVRERTKQLRGRQRVERHVPVRAPRYRRRGVRGLFRRRWGIPVWTRHIS
jgi:hypothetical protein